MTEFGSSAFHSYGKLVRKYPFPICGCWLCCLIFGIVLFPIRGEKAEDVIQMWIPDNGKVKYAAEYTNNLYKQQDYYTEMDGLAEKIDDLDANDDFWRGSDDYFHIWGYNKNGRGDSLNTRQAVAEWYNFSLELVNMNFEVEGKNQVWQDVCLFQYATNADFYHHVFEDSYYFPGYQTGFSTLYAASQGGSSPSTEGVPGTMWDSILVSYPESLAGGAENTHLKWHSLAVIEATKDTLAGLLAAAPACDTDNGITTNCVKDVPLLFGQDAYNDNCLLLLQGLAAANPSLQSVVNTFPLVTANERTTICASYIVYSSVPGASDFESTCFVSDVSFCIQDAIGEYYGSLFGQPLTATNYGDAYATIPTEAELFNQDMSDEDFMAKLETCGFLSLTREASGKYYRTSKFVVEPVVLARRLQQQAGNCTYAWPSSAQMKAVYEASLTSELQAMEEAALPAYDNLTACAAAQSVLIELQTLQAQIIAGTQAGDDTTALQQQAGALMAGATYQTYGVACTNALPYIDGDTALITNLLTAEGAAALGFTVWYKSSGVWTCPDYDDSVIQRALDVRNTVNEQLLAAVDSFNDRAVYMQASVLSDQTADDGYDNLFTQNAILIIVGISAMFIFVIAVNYNNWKAALLSMFMNLLCVFATLGLMEMPYTPSVIQFLPYLMIGIGVDDLFVVLGHYTDEDNVPKTLHHAGMAITITSMTNVCVFVLFRLLTHVPDIRIFTGAAAIGMALLYGNILFGVTPILYIVEWLEGRLDDPNRTPDEFHGEIETFGTNALVNYTRANKTMKPFKNIFAVVFVILIFLGMTTVACLKITGNGFDQPEFGLKISELIEEDDNDHLYVSVSIFEDFPLFIFNCGAGKEKGDTATGWNGRVFDDYAPRFREFCNDLDGIKGTFRTSTAWTLKLTDDGDQDYPYYTSQARTFPTLPDPSVYWKDQDHYIASDIVAPQGSFVNVPEDFEGRTSADTISNFYDVVDNYEDIGAFCQSTVMEVFERYIGVEAQLLGSVGLTLGIVFIVALAMIQDIGAVLILTFVDACTAFQLWGFFSLLGLRMNNVLILNIMFGAAFMVQYTAHLARRFVISPANSRWYRVVDALSLYSGPLLWGALSTALAVSVAAFLPIKYFRLYYFRAFVIIVVFGLFNGLIVQSALLVLIPTSFATAAQPMFGEEEGAKTIRRRFSSDAEHMDKALGNLELTSVQE